ncbi:MAG: hypothetical protein QOG48_382 [Verrucomicrobiota bacterium]|jgi:hypothetical protein
MLSTSEPHARVLPELSVPITPAIPRAESRARTGAPRTILFLVAGFALLGVAFAFWLRQVPAGNPDPRLAFNVFYYLFARNEPAGLALVALFSILSALVFFRQKSSAAALANEDVDLPRWICPVIALFVFVVAAVGTDFVFHTYMVTADEHLADFQARIFLRGKLQAQVPPAWIDAVRVIKPTYVDYFPATHSWNETYLPAYAAMRAAFQAFDLQSMLNPFLAALTVLGVYATARNIWPESKTHALIAAGLLASSSQFLLMSMTSYSMPAHLALNAIWLWLYSRPNERKFYLAPFVGVVAIGLHQPIVHALFVLPFLVRLVWQRRWRAMSIFAIVYLAGCALWYFWRAHFQGVGPHGVGSIFKFANPRMPIIQSMNLLLIIGWASLATPLLAVLAFGRFCKSKPILQDAMLSCALTFGFYFFFFLDQAHGWGYRYFHGALACFALVAAAGFERLSELIGRKRAHAFVLAGISMSILLQFPLRCVQAERFVRPYARAATVLHAMHYDIVAFDARDAWYSADLIRNDPFLEKRPVLVSIYGQTTGTVGALSKNGSVRFITRDDLTRLGMFTARPDPKSYGRDPFQLGRGN